MPIIDVQNTVDTLLALSKREGGDLHYENKQSLNSFSDWATASTIPFDFIPFRISIFDTEINEDMVSLTLMVNPKDLYVSQSQVIDSAYSRAGWINTLWGNQQGLLTASGMTAGFYYTTPQKSGGLTNFYRRNSLAYLNMLSIVSFFKNNGYYFMDGMENPTLFKDGTSRVINVMDTIRISYDGSDYLGSFSSFSINDVAANPYRLDYNLEFNISSFGTDLQGIEGHIKKEGNDTVNKVQISIQGSNTRFDHTVLLNSDELNTYFPPDAVPANAPISYNNAVDGTTPKGVTLSIKKVPKAWGTLIQKYADIYKVDPNLIAAVIAQESRGNQYATSKDKYGNPLAKGLMQMIDSTAADMGVTDPYDPEQSINGGTKYLSRLLKKYNGDTTLALAAYNAGPGNVDKYKGVPPFAETQDYVVKVNYYHDYYGSAKTEKD